MPHPKTMSEALDDFYGFLMEHKGWKPHEIDQMDIHHVFKLVRNEQKRLKEQLKGKPTEEKPKQVFIDQIPGWD